MKKTTRTLFGNDTTVNGHMGTRQRRYRTRNCRWRRMGQRLGILMVKILPTLGLS